LRLKADRMLSIRYNECYLKVIRFFFLKVMRMVDQNLPKF